MSLNRMHRRKYRKKRITNVHVRMESRGQFGGGAAQGLLSRDQSSDADGFMTVGIVPSSSPSATVPLPKGSTALPTIPPMIVVIPSSFFESSELNVTCPASFGRVSISCPRHTRLQTPRSVSIHGVSHRSAPARPPAPPPLAAPPTPGSSPSAHDPRGGSRARRCRSTPGPRTPRWPCRPHPPPPAPPASRPVVAREQTRGRRPARPRGA